MFGKKPKAAPAAGLRSAAVPAKKYRMPKARPASAGGDYRGKKGGMIC